MIVVTALAQCSISSAMESASVVIQNAMSALEH